MLAFKNILVPADSMTDAETAAKKAIELCGPDRATIHLAYSEHHKSILERFFPWKAPEPGSFTDAKDAFSQLAELKEKLNADTGCADFVVEQIPDKTDTTGMADYISTHGIDLVVINKHENGQATGCNDKTIAVELVNETTIPVLTITGDCLNHPVKSILLPVDDVLTQEKIKLALLFARHYHAQIHLVALLHNNEPAPKAKTDAFYMAYKILAEYGHSPHYKILQGTDTADMLLRYAAQVKADLILVNAEKKTSFLSQVQKKMTDLLHPLASLHILSLKLSI